jgi:predicted RecB family nuclease
MRKLGTSTVFSPSDLNAFLACPHLTSLELAVARGEQAKPFRPNAQVELVRAKGEEHEAWYLQRLSEEGRDIVEIDLASDFDWRRAARATEEAMDAGREVVYQAILLDGAWRGIADFVMRQADGTYQTLDTKLARHTRPAHILQLCFYTEQIARIQGSWPRKMSVVTGTGEVEHFRPDDYLAFYRRLRSRFLAAVETGGRTYPYPVEHCSLCDFLSLCKQQWADDDHLVLVAGISRSQVERLNVAGIETLEALGDIAPGTRVGKIRPATFDTIRHQAELQLHRRRKGAHRVDQLPVEQDRGFALVPEPSAGDVWLDLEGDPWYEPARGLEYLFGWVYLDDDGRAVYDCIWGHDRAEEKSGFERLVDFLVERRYRYPGMHVYHYAPYERTALTRLMGEHGTRENEIDELLRGEALVDLYRVLRQSLRASVPNYSIKTVEELYDFERTAGVGGGSESVVAFEQWLELRDDALLEGIRAYNEEDCRSLYELHEWLLRLRPRDLAWRPPPEQRELSEEAEEAIDERERVRDVLLAGADEGEPRWLLAQLLEYDRREEKPQWWAYFNNLTLDEEELIASTETIGDLELVGEPVEDKQSLVYMLRFPPQEHKISGKAVDPKTEKAHNVRVDDEQGVVELRRAKRKSDEPLPDALIPPEPLHAGVQREALLRFAKDQLRFPALIEILERRPPRARLDVGPVEAALSLDRSYLFVQGPPGSGKTHWGARMAVALMKAEQRVGVTALSHKAIHHFLTKVEGAAAESGFSFRGRKKASGDPETRFEGRFIDCTDDNAEMVDDHLQLIAGTSWLFSRPELERHVDTLFVDEGGQVALADALAAGTAARTLVLLGDPNQLPQVSQGAHPPGANASVLSHLLGDDETVRDDRGLFLGQTWRLRPEVNAFISQTFYEGRLGPADVCETRSLAAGNGLRYLPVDHVGRRIASPEEAKAVRDDVEGLVGTPFRDGARERPLTYADVVVVAPYNAQVRCLREKLPTAVRVGTVDKFQGQEAPVVFYSMASSSGEDVPRGLDFLFSRNRLNVAISRAECLAYLVASPRLLDASCRTVEQMRLANGLCRLVELAESQTSSSTPPSPLRT